MGGFAAVLAGIIPVAETIVTSIANKIKAGAQGPASPTTPSGPVATAITGAPGFAQSVEKKDQTAAANAAAAAVPAAVQQQVADGVKAALAQAGVAQKNAAAQLKAVAALLDASSVAEDYLFAIDRFISSPQKATFSDEDKTLLKLWWASADTKYAQLKSVAASATTSPDLLDDGPTASAFRAAIGYNTEDYGQIGDSLKSIGASIPAGTIANVKILANCLNQASIQGAVTINAISKALGQASGA